MPLSSFSLFFESIVFLLFYFAPFCQCANFSRPSPTLLSAIKVPPARSCPLSGPWPCLLSLCNPHQSPSCTTRKLLLLFFCMCCLLATTQSRVKLRLHIGILILYCSHQVTRPTPLPVSLFLVAFHAPSGSPISTGLRIPPSLPNLFDEGKSRGAVKEKKGGKGKGLCLCGEVDKGSAFNACDFFLIVFPRARLTRLLIRWKLGIEFLLQLSLVPIPSVRGSL